MVDADGRPLAPAAALSSDGVANLNLDRGPWVQPQPRFPQVDFSSRAVRTAIAIIVCAVAVSAGAWALLSLLPAAPIG